MMSTDPTLEARGKGRKRPRFDDAMSHVTLEMLEEHFHLPLRDAAEAFGVCITFFKKICRAHGIKRWPHRKVAQIHKLHEKLGEEVPELSVETLEMLRKKEEEESNGDRERVPIWDKVKRRKLAGMAAPLKHRLRLYLWEHPDCEVYDGQDREKRLVSHKNERLSLRVMPQRVRSTAKRVKCERGPSPALSDSSPSQDDSQGGTSPMSHKSNESNSTIDSSSAECEVEMCTPGFSVVEGKTVELEDVVEAVEVAPVAFKQEAVPVEWFEAQIDQPWGVTPDATLRSQPLITPAHPVQGKCVADFVDKLDDREFSQFVDAIGDSWAGDECVPATTLLQL